MICQGALNSVYLKSLIIKKSRKGSVTNQCWVFDGTTSVTGFI